MGRLVEFAAACLAVGTAGWRGFLAYLKWKARLRRKGR